MKSLQSGNNTQAENADEQAKRPEDKLQEMLQGIGPQIKKFIPIHHIDTRGNTYLGYSEWIAQGGECNKIISFVF